MCKLLYARQQARKRQTVKGRAQHTRRPHQPTKQNNGLRKSKQARQMSGSPGPLENQVETRHHVRSAENCAADVVQCHGPSFAADAILQNAHNLEMTNRSPKRRGSGEWISSTIHTLPHSMPSRVKNSTATGTAHAAHQTEDKQAIHSSRNT